MKTFKIIYETGPTASEFIQVVYRAKNKENALKRFLRERPSAKGQEHNIYVTEAKAAPKPKKLKLTPAERKILKALGWEKSNEEGALMQHPDLYDLDRFLWESDKFEDGLKKVQRRLEKLNKAAYGIQSVMSDLKYS